MSIAAGGAVDPTRTAPMTAALPPCRPVLYRRGGHRYRGVASGIADHIGVRPAWVRLAFVVLTVSGGFGFALYATFWIMLPQAPTPARKPRLPAWVEYPLLALLALLLLWGTVTAAPFGRLFVPAVLACLGGALIWRQASESQRERWLRLSRSSLAAHPAERIGVMRLFLGATLVITGAVTVLVRTDLSGARDGLVAILVTLVGVGLITGPWWIRMVGELAAERRERIRSQERADLAAQLHDSVLQTLALIQRNADSPREVSRLARGQERELRTLLYATPSATGRLGDALKAAAADVDDAYGVAVEVVLVGDADLDERLNALVAATREALVNAAKHAAVDSISLYAEVEAADYAVFVRDRGVGFTLDQTADDRQGIRGSIIARVERYGGSGHIDSSPGHGTEVKIRMPR